MLRNVSLRRRVTALAATVAVVLVAVMTVTTFLVVRQALYGSVDTDLRNRAASLIDSSALALDPRGVATLATAFTTDINVALMYPDGTVYAPGEPIPIGPPEIAVAAAEQSSSLHTERGQRIFAERSATGVTLVLSQRLEGTQDVLDHLALVLGVVGGAGVFFAAAAGAVVGRTGLRPVSRLTAATERVARTSDLTLIPVSGDDELARLTMSFNTMLQALAESRERQSRLVADAGHELKTPLTSLRTNMELLIAVSRPGARTIPDEDMTELRDDVMGQLEELSTLVSDLVDLAREDSPELVHERVDLLVVLDRTLDRVRRRRTDVDFRVWAEPWTVDGDPGGYSRAVLNVLDNAAKWSPLGEHVEVMLRRIGEHHAELLVGDAGPGIPEQDRQLVFERFYRSTDARSMPGSGLGLSIARQVVDKYGGSIEAGESDRGGALIRIVLPGVPETSELWDPARHPNTRNPASGENPTANH